MPLAAELLLLDADGREPMPPGGYHVATARRLYGELAHQLQDTRGLRRRSAFGALLARGASLRLMREDAGPATASGAPPAAAAGQAMGTDSVPLAPDLATGQATASSSSSSTAPGPAQLPRCQAQRIKVVPAIPRFPQAKQPAAAGAKGLLDTLFGWLPSCTSATCESANVGAIDSCTIVFSPDEQAAAPCMSLPTSAAPVEAEGTAERPAAHEAGLGGWPLCVPEVHAALLAPDVQGPDRAADGFAPAMLDSAQFHKAAMEVDDSELAVIFPRASGSSTCGTSRPPLTPSTASTVSRASRGEPPPSPAAQLPWMARRRLVFPRNQISKVKLWPGPDLHPETVPLAGYQNQTGPTLQNLVEVSGAPLGAPGPVVLVLALPSGEIASRLHEALRRGGRAALGLRSAARPAPGALGADAPRQSLRCELLVAASIRLEPEEQRATCEVVIQRSLCEALGVPPDRLRVLSLRELEGAEAHAVHGHPLALARSPMELPPAPALVAGVLPGPDLPLDLQPPVLGGGSAVVE
mmetsp:Transcript_95986/g.298880  ORF Transcript_95986/g.298880 Transcript_95986/m.298880 type:complete len:525 (-) Transcript_95986:90-1664(-)